MGKKPKRCIVACSSLKDEIEELKKQGSIDLDVFYVSKLFHVDYDLIEKNLRKMLKRVIPLYPNGVVLIYGDLCLGANNEMKKLAQELGVVKVDALNCIDCQLGGKGRILREDPNRDFLFFSAGWLDFFNNMKKSLSEKGVDEAEFASYFSELKGIVLVDTLGDAENYIMEIYKLGLGLPVLEVKHVGLEGLKDVLKEAMDQK